jgi:hypothetical protein
MSEGKPIMVHLNGNFGDLIKDVMRDPDLPFENLKLFTEIANYELYLRFKEVKNNPKELAKFKTRMKELAETMIKKELINETLYGWKSR